MHGVRVLDREQLRGSTASIVGPPQRVRAQDERDPWTFCGVPIPLESDGLSAVLHDDALEVEEQLGDGANERSQVADALVGCGRKRFDA